MEELTNTSIFWQQLERSRKKQVISILNDEHILVSGSVSTSLFVFCFTSQNDSIGGVYRGDGESKCWVTVKNEWGGKWQEPGDTQQVTDKILTVCFLPLHACSSSLQSCSLPYCAGLLDGRAQDATKPEKSAKWCGIEIFPLSFQPEHFVFLFWSRDLKNVLSVLSHWVMSGIFGSLRSSGILTSFIS